MPLVSVIIPLFNKEAYVADSLKSVFCQSYSNFEILIVNDGSTDGSLAKVEQFRDRRITVINKNNEGVSIARNVGAAHSRGEVLAFLDADDLWFRDHLFHIVAAAKKFPEAGAVCNSFCRKAVESEDSFAVTYSLVVDYIYQAARGRKIMWTSAAAMRKEIFEEVRGFPPNESHGEDLALWVKAALQAPVVFTDYTGALYRDTMDGLTAKLVCYPDALTNTIDQILTEQRFSEKEKRSLRKYRTRNALAQAITACLHGNKQEALKFLSVAKICPENFCKYFSLLILAYLPKKASSRILSNYISSKK